MASKVGFLGSSQKLYLIETGSDGSTGQIDLGRQYALIVIRCENCANIPDSTTLSVLTAMNEGDILTDLHEINDPSTKWSKGVPTTGTLQFALSHAFGSRFIRLDLSNNVAGNVTFKIYGFDPIVTEG